MDVLTWSSEFKEVLYIYPGHSSQIFWSQDPFMPLEIVKDTKELCLGVSCLLIFTILNTKIEKI